MLPDLVEVEEGIFQSSANGGHSTHCGTLELLALEKGLRIFEKSDIIAGYDFNQMFRSRHLAQGNSEVVGIVESIQKIFMERVDVL